MHNYSVIFVSILYLNTKFCAQLFTLLSTLEMEHEVNGRSSVDSNQNQWWREKQESGWQSAEEVVRSRSPIKWSTPLTRMDTVQGTTSPGSRDGEKFPTRTITT